MNNKLIQCPFCGGKRVWKKFETPKQDLFGLVHYEAVCKQCATRSSIYGTLREYAEAYGIEL